MLVIALPARFPLRTLLALALGCLHAMSFVEDSAWPIQIATLAGLVALAMRAAREIEGRRGSLRALSGGARVGFAFGLGWLVTGVSWIYISLHTYGEMNPLIAGSAVIALSAYLAVYPALACAGFAWFRHAGRPGATASIAVFAALWSLSEIGRGFVFTGFPWIASGYAHVAGPLAGYAPVVGVYGVSLIAAAIAASIALAAVGSRSGSEPQSTRPSMIVLLALVFGLPLAGAGLARIAWSSPSGAPISVRLLQGNVPQDTKFVEDSFAGIADDYLTMIEAKRADLIVLPETAFPRFLTDLPDAVEDRLVRDTRELKAAIAFGVPIVEGEDRYFNSVIALSADSDGAVETQRYDKSHLLPWGEFIPWGFHWFVRLMKMPLGDFTRGSQDQQPMRLAGHRIAFNICYEDLFGEDIIRQAATADILVNVSNLAWFGDSMALPQNLDFSRMRAIETARPVLRATNTGMTASIDPHGRVLSELPPFTRGSLDVTVQAMTGMTPYLRFGNAPVLILIALLLAAAAWGRRLYR